MGVVWNKVTWYSRVITLILLVALPFLGFWAGLKYAERRGPLKIVAVRAGEDSMPPDGAAPAPAGATANAPAPKEDLLAQNTVSISADKSFSVPSLPDVTFVIHGVRKAYGGAAAERCGPGANYIFLRHSQLFAAQGTCIDVRRPTDGAPTALAVVDLEVRNESNAYIDGRFLQLFYASGGDDYRVAEMNPPLEGYGALPRGTRRMLVGFAVPETLLSAQITYGDYGRLRAASPSREELFGKSIGGYLVNFTTRTFAEIPG